jgi:putative ABC transport system ATP-binding protein
MNETIVELWQVVKKYQGKASAVTALKGIDLRVDAGEFVAVLGKSGAGKSTLVNMIAGIDRPTSGEIKVAGTAVHALGEDDRAAWRGRNAGVVLQFFQLLPTLTVLQNVGIAEHARKLPSAMSGGQQQRIAIARSLANDPPILLADEPTGSLDSTTANQVMDVFEELVSQGKTLLMATHDKDMVKRARRTILLADGEIVER